MTATVVMGVRQLFPDKEFDTKIPFITGNLMVPFNVSFRLSWLPWRSFRNYTLFATTLYASLLNFQAHITTCDFHLLSIAPGFTSDS